MASLKDAPLGAWLPRLPFRQVLPDVQVHSRDRRFQFRHALVHRVDRRLILSASDIFLPGRRESAGIEGRRPYAKADNDPCLRREGGGRPVAHLPPRDMDESIITKMQARNRKLKAVRTSWQIIPIFLAVASPLPPQSS